MQMWFELWRGRGRPAQATANDALLPAGRQTSATGTSFPVAGAVLALPRLLPVIDWDTTVPK